MELLAWLSILYFIQNLKYMLQSGTIFTASTLTPSSLISAVFQFYMYILPTIPAAYAWSLSVQIDVCAWQWLFATLTT